MADPFRLLIVDDAPEHARMVAEFIRSGETWADAEVDVASSYSEALAAFDEFVYEFGSRGPNEWDIHSHTWETQPDLVLAAIDRMRQTDDAAAPDDRNRRTGLHACRVERGTDR